MNLRSVLISGVVASGSLLAQTNPAIIFIADLTPANMTGAPFSATQIVERSQEPHTAIRPEEGELKMYRDSAGRRRTEWTERSSQRPTSVTISDPVAGFRYELEPYNKTARKFVLLKPWPSPPPPTTPLQIPETLVGVVYNRPIMDGAVRGIGLADGHYHTTYQLFATRLFEGVPADGKRITTTLEPGALENENEIVVEDESWYSSQLQVFVQTRLSDPRFGTRLIRLTNVSLAEPDPALFIVPSDYAVKDMPSVP